MLFAIPACLNKGFMGLFDVWIQSQFLQVESHRLTELLTAFGLGSCSSWDENHCTQEQKKKTFANI